jgi:hypothetical protein
MARKARRRHIGFWFVTGPDRKRIMHILARMVLLSLVLTVPPILAAPQDRQPRDGIFTQVLQKLDGKWLIAASHNTNIVIVPGSPVAGSAPGK